MQKIYMVICLYFLFLGSSAQYRNDNCTSVLVSRGASTDGSVMITYACDAEFVGRMEYISATDYGDDAYI